MRINYETISFKLRPKNINCNNENIVRIKEKVTHHIYLILLLCIFIPAKFLCAQTDATKKEEENLNVFQEWIKWNNPGSLVLYHLNKQAEDYYKIRDNEIATLKTKDDWIKRQQVVRVKLRELIGPFPKKEALNPEIMGIVQKEGYRIEKIIYQSVPGFYETGCLYIPDKIKGKAPAILNVFGHDQASFREEYYQVIITNLVKKGMIVFAIDPLGQGEHVQYYDTSLKFSAIGYSVIEHCYFGNICFLSGIPSAKYFIWDGIRAIDYLLTRKEVDPENIGVTGFSGGGTVSAYLGAFDDRIKVAVPCSWPLTYRTELETKGIQDAENTLIGGITKGITFEDLIEVRSPKPTLMSFTTRDENMPFQGALDALKEAKKTYAAFGKEDNVQLVEDDAKHAMTPKIRLAMYAFFQKHFNLTGNPAEEKTDLPTKQELTVTPTGQVATYKGGKMIFDLNKTESEKLISNIEQSRKNIVDHLNKVKIKAKEISGYVSPSQDKEELFINGRYQRDGYTVELDAIPGESEKYAIPVLLFKPDNNLTKHPAIIYLHSKGKITDAAPGGEIEKLVNKGYIVAAADVLGIGETANTAARGYTDGYTAVLIGRSMVGIRAGDIVRVANYLKSQNDVDPRKIGAIAFDEMCLSLIHAAAFDSSIKNITLIRPLISYQSVVMNRFYKIGITKRPNSDYWHPIEVDFTWGIASVLTAYDLPDLIGSIAPRKVVLAELRNPMLESASPGLISEGLKFPRAAYSFKNVSGNLKIVEKIDTLDSIADWSFK
ncbi:MAG TPA: alpha/beta hydrolase family protein [Chitinophagaceae bacterium]|jgi:dienelactone hydrolase